MPNLTPTFYKTTNNIKTNHYIETGTYLGEGIHNILGSYENIHSIELSQTWYDHNVKQFENNNSVKMYLGDSKKILPDLLKNINEPVTIFLDAHYSGTPTAYGDEETPLLFELEILKERNYDDIIIIDDCRMLGKSGISGGGKFDVKYPDMFFDWLDITEQSIINLMKPGYVLLKNTNGFYTDGPRDQFILAKNN